MAKTEKPKTAAQRGGRNPDRPSGKAWSQHSDRRSGPAAGIVTRGHHASGRTKPSGSSVGGHSRTKIAKSDTLSFEGIRASREHSNRWMQRNMRRRRSVAASERDS